MRYIKQVAVLAISVSLAACGGSSGYPTSNNNNPPPPTGGTNITVSNNTFAPGNLSVTAGQTVTWNWDACTGTDPYTGQPGTCVSHSVMFDDGVHSDVLSQGSYNRTFSAKGSFPYHCSIHGTAMSGTITVQ